MPEIFKFLPAELHECDSGWFVRYYVENPFIKKLVRKKIKINRISNILEKRKFAKSLIHDLNHKLYNGWNPFLEQESPKAFFKLTEVFKIFLEMKKKENKKTTFQSYSCYIENITKYLIKNKMEDLLILNFDNKIINSFMNDLYLSQNIGNRTFNNYRDFGSTFLNWCIENLYCKVNYFKSITKKKKQNKKRIVIDNENKAKIKDYLLNNNYIEFYTMCLIQYHTFIRPIEIMQLKPENFNLEKNTMILTPDMTKDNDYRYLTITDNLKYYLKKINLDKINKNEFVFSRKFKPGLIKASPKDISKFWFKMRKELNLKEEIQFYSLKDTGIVDMLRSGISPAIVRDQAGHSSLEMTNKYIQIAKQTANNDIINLMENF